MDAGETGKCVLAQLPEPIVVHTVFFGWFEKGQKSWFRKEYVRCLALTWAEDKERGWHSEATGNSCPFCDVIGGDRWRIVQIAGVLDLRAQKEPLIDPEGYRYNPPPRMLVLDETAQAAILQGLAERCSRGAEPIGTVFRVTRGTKQNDSRIGTNWVPMLDEEVSPEEIKKHYWPIDVGMAYPVLDGKSKGPFPAEQQKEIVRIILQRHVNLCVAHADQSGTKFDTYAAQKMGLSLERSTDTGDDNEEEAEGISTTPVGRSLITQTVTTKTGPDLTDLGDKAPKPEAAKVEEEEEEEVGEEDLVKMGHAAVKELAAEWGISIKGKDPQADKLAILTDKKGFGLDSKKAMALLPAEKNEEEGEEAEEEGEAEEGEDLEALKEQLLDKAKTPISEVAEKAKALGVEPVTDSKGKVVRAKTVDAIIAHMEDNEGGERPWEE